MLEERGLTYQPQILLVGPSLKEVETIYVSIDNTRFEMKNVIDAVDTCYKMIFAMNAAYPLESTNIWLFIEICLFEHENSGDKLSSQLFTFMNTFRNTNI